MTVDPDSRSMACGDQVPMVRTEGSVIHAGRQVATAEGRIVGADGTGYAHATTTCLIFNHLPARRDDLRRGA